MEDNVTVETMVETFIEEVYVSYVLQLYLVSTAALLLYTTVLTLDQEIQCIWLKRFTLPSLLYVFARYGYFISAVLQIWANFLPVAIKSLLNAVNSVFVLAYIGINGLLVTRAYSFCHQHKIITALLFFFPLSGLVFLLLDIILSENNLPNESSLKLIAFFGAVSSVATDGLVFTVCLWNVWGAWKLKREIGIQRDDLVSAFTKQIITRFCFAVALAPAATILSMTIGNSHPLISKGVTDFQNALSFIMICGFTLDLRQRNCASPKITTLPTLQFQSVLHYIQDSILTEMGDRNETVKMEMADEKTYHESGPPEDIGEFSRWQDHPRIDFV